MDIQAPRSESTKLQKTGKGTSRRIEGGALQKQNK